MAALYCCWQASAWSSKKPDDFAKAQSALVLNAYFFMVVISSISLSSERKFIMNPQPQTISDIIRGIIPISAEWVQKAAEHNAQLCIPPRALGRLHSIAEQLCGIQKTMTPDIGRRAVLVMAGDHGVVAEGISAFPQEITGAMIRVFLSDGAGINAICHQVGADVWVVDMGIIPDIDPDSTPGGNRLKIEKIARGTQNLAKGPAMTREDAEKAIMAGFRQAARLFEGGVQILGTGDMGIGNTTPSAAIGTVLTGINVEKMVGPGTGIKTDGIQRKIKAILAGIAINKPDAQDGLDVLAKLGGFEIAGIAGCILAGAYYQRPVVVDGLISTAGALIAHRLCPTVRDYLFAGHCSEEPGHRLMLNSMEMTPILDLGMRLGEGTGAALAMNIMDGAVSIFTRVMTFQQAGITE